MSFQAPETDAAPPAGFKAPADDADAPKWSDLPGHIVPDAENMLKSGADTALRIGKGVYDLPSDLVETGRQELTGGNPLDTPIAQDVKTVGEGAVNAVKAIPGQLKDLVSKDAWIAHPVGNALTGASLVAPFLGGEGAAIEGAKPPADIVSRGTMPEEPLKTPPVESVAPVPPSPELPVVQPFSKTGDPHALFAYNDKFGPGGTERSIYNVFGDPENPVVKAVGHGSSVTKADLEKAGIPIVGREPRSVGKWEPLDLGDTLPPLEPMAGKGTAGVPPSQMPPDPNAPAPKPDLFKDVRDYINAKYQKAQERPGLIPRLGNYLTEEANKLGSKDIGMQSGLIKTMGTGFKGVEKANQLIDYAREQGYLKAGLSDAERRTLIKNTLDASGDALGKMRKLADSRGTPDVDAIKTAVKTALDQKYGYGTQKAPGEIANVMDDIEHAPKTFSGMAELATKLNKSATPVTKLGQHPGPTTDAADLVARLTHDGIRRVFTPEENDLYTKSLRDFGANKKLEQTTASAARREMGARSNQRGVLGRAWQEALDRGGYRVGGNIANRVGKSIQSGRVKTLPQFFEDLAHQSNEEIDDTINHMSKGGIVPDDIKRYVAARC